MSDTPHCWHGDGLVLTSDPPQHKQVFCHCGVECVLVYRELPVTGHGPYFNATVVSWAYSVTTPCAGAVHDT